jgi:hypothetical protein
MQSLIVVHRCSCRTETLSTLRFAQRAKAMQNKAVVNEETANDVNLLREQIRQLKVLSFLCSESASCRVTLINDIQMQIMCMSCS